MRNFPRTICRALALAASLSWLHAGDFEEKFADAPSGAMLTTVPGWQKPGEGPDTWTISMVEEQGTNYIEAPQPGIYRLDLEQRNASIMATDGPVDLKLKIKCTAKTDAYAEFAVDLRKSDGVNGVGLRFSGGKQAGNSDNILRGSSGGTSWGDVQLRDLAQNWRGDAWYQIEIRDVDLTRGGISGKLTIYPVDDPQNKLVDNEEITGYGKGKIDRLDLLTLSSMGAARSFQIGDISITPASKRP